MSVVDGFCTPPPRSPFLFLFNVTGLAHMTLSSSVGTARARAALPAGALELDLQDKKKKTSRGLIDISALLAAPHLSSPVSPQLFYSIYATPYLFPLVGRDLSGCCIFNLSIRLR